MDPATRIGGIVALRRLTLLPVAVSVLTAVILAFRGASSGDGIAASGSKLPKCDPSQPSVEFGSPQFWTRLVLSVFLVLAGGVMAGLTLAFMTLDPLNLQVLQRSDVEQEREWAAKIAPIRKHEHWLLITLLLANVIINESLPILLDDILGGGFLAIFISTALVVCFGEIIPNAVCNRWGLPIAAFFAPLVRLLMFVLFPLAWPMSKLLDWALEGEKGATVYRRGELKALIGLHEDGRGGGELSADEVNIIRATLDLSNKSVRQVMTPMEDVYMLSIDGILDREAVREIRRKGHSRIPVYEGSKRNVRAMFLVKNLIDYDPHDCCPVRQFPLMFLPIIAGDTNLFDALNLFQEGRSHMALVADNVADLAPGGKSPHPSFLARPRSGSGSSRVVSAQESSASLGLDLGLQPPPDDIIGIVTLEDVLEELIGEEIIDETDEFVDVHTRQVAKRKPWKSLKSIQALVGPYLVRTTKKRAYGATGISPALQASDRRAMTPDTFLVRKRGATAPDALAPSSGLAHDVSESSLLIPPANRSDYVGSGRCTALGVAPRDGHWHVFH
ncbi:hypothetical protein DFJ74DRAFT_680363 [Hyaloraphidium curvatum]|nr:hypothetical protein DFJ74DRAFT_680363 [Hyaloraphidium curvatum]